MADWVNQNQVIGIFGGIHYPRPVGIVHMKCNMLAISTVSEMKKYFTHKLTFYYESVVQFMDKKY